MLQSSLVRGVLTAMSWLTELRYSTAPSAREALENASQALLQAEIKLPQSLNPATYERPKRPNVAETG